MHRSSIRFRAAASLIAVLGLAACSSDKSSSDTTVAAAETQAAAETTAAAAAETAAPAAETQAAAETTTAAATATEAAAPASNEPQELTISYNKTGDWPEPEATLQAAKTGFEAANPGVKINLQSEVAADDAFRTKTQLRLQSGKDLPDIIPTTAGFVDADVKAGYLLPIDSALDTWADWTKLYPEAIREGAKAFDGKTYYIPQASNDIGIWYNKDVFAKAGLPEKWEPQSWADLRTAAETIKAKVLDVDVEKERVSLGVKQLGGDPVGEGDLYKKGQTVTVTVTSIESGGIEVKFGEDDAPVSSFVRKSDISRDRNEQRPERYAVGDRVDAQITSIDKATRRVSVSIKALEMADEKEAIDQFGSSDSGASLGDILGAALREKAGKD